MSEFDRGFAAMVAEMPCVQLGEVNEAAALQTRIDRKYVVALDLLDRLDFDEHVMVLEIDTRRHFHYATTYFDTKERDLYLDTAYRRPSRFKVRIRSYVDSGLTLLEVKRKDGRSKTVKSRQPVATGAELSCLTPSMRAFVNAEVDTELTDRLGIAATTRFNRTTAVDTVVGARYTIDRNVRADTPDGRIASLADAAVVETKSSGGPTPLDRFLWSQNIRPASFSKYCTAMATLEPSLPANHWHRTLNRYFGRHEQSASHEETSD